MTFNIRLMRKHSFDIYGEYENLDFQNTRAVLIDCLEAGNTAYIKVQNNTPFLNGRSIKNDYELRLFIEEFGGIENE